jgi:ABC-type dipeptide/oligopeptide/nickel transport system permease component
MFWFLCIAASGIFAGGYGLLLLLQKKGVRRESVVRLSVVISGVVAILSAFAAYKFRGDWSECKETWGYALIGFWVIAPPLYFLTEHSIWPPASAERDAVEHVHDLARNLWLAVVVLLALIMGVGIELFRPG